MELDALCGFMRGSHKTSRAFCKQSFLFSCALVLQCQYKQTGNWRLGCILEGVESTYRSRVLIFWSKKQCLFKITHQKHSFWVSSVNAFKCYTACMETTRNHTVIQQVKTRKLWKLVILKWWPDLRERIQKGSELKQRNEVSTIVIMNVRSFSCKINACKRAFNRLFKLYEKHPQLVNPICKSSLHFFGGNLLFLPWNIEIESSKIKGEETQKNKR